MTLEQRIIREAPIGSVKRFDDLPGGWGAYCGRRADGKVAQPAYFKMTDDPRAIEAARLKVGRFVSLDAQP